MDLKEVQVHITEQYLVFTDKDESYLVMDHKITEPYPMDPKGHNHWWNNGSDVCTLQDLVEALKVVKMKKDKV